MEAASLGADPARIELVGAFRLAIGGKTVVLASRKARAVIACLAMARGHRDTRGRLVGLLWSETPEERAKASLRQALFEIREAAGDGFIVADKHTIALAAPPGVDILDAIRDLRAGVVPPAIERDRLVDGLLTDLENVDPAFTDWLAQKREEIRRDISALLEKLASQPGDAAATAAEALLRLDPANEAGVRAAMKARASVGDAGGALGVYKALWEKLAQDFDVEPSEETQKLAAEIKLAQPFTDSPPADATASGQSSLQSTAAAPPLASRDGPSLAVLPFVNMSGDPEQEYFADGMTEEIITALSRVKWFFVIARNSSFTYKGRAVDVRQVGRDLGVRYVLEGSVRKAGNRLRITGQLVEAETGRHVWAEKFDGELDDVFAFQDRVAESVAAAIEPSVRHAEILRSNLKPTENLQAYDLVLRALPHIMMVTNRESNDDAIASLNKAVMLDPNYAQAWGILGSAHAFRRGQGWSTAETEREGIRAADKAVILQSEDPIALSAAGLALGFIGRRHTEAVGCVDRAYALNPNSARVLSYSGWVNIFAGRDEVAVARFERYLRLSPVDLEAAYIHGGLAQCLFSLERYNEGLAMARLSVAEAPHWMSSHRALIINLVGSGLVEEAREAMTILRKLMPGLTMRTLPRARQNDSYAERYDTAMRAAGLPE